ncbi:O-antigen polymerase [Pseudomonas putida S11]|nr:O-antigen polymerase [Pseudomonas putida S11]
MLLLLAWSGLSLVWSAAENPGREAKRLLYILVFLLAFPLLGQLGQARIRQLLLAGSALLAVAALISVIHFYGVLGMPLLARLEGIGEISHPILGAYVIGSAVLFLLYEPPRQRGLQLLWLVALVCLGLFAMLSQSRGAILALVLTVILAPLWFRDRHSRVFAVLAAIATCLAFYLVYDLVARRGSSYRPEIFHAVVDMIAAHPWTGLGLGAAYDVSAVGKHFDHTHNMFHPHRSGDGPARHAAVGHGVAVHPGRNRPRTWHVVRQDPARFLGVLHPGHAVRCRQPHWYAT